jgi:site-specific DNA-cytosine methylase
MKVLDLFSGIGGFSLGLEWAGMSTVAMCEKDPYCRKILAKHWPEKYCPNEFEITNEDDGTLTLFFSTRVTEG